MNINFKIIIYQIFLYLFIYNFIFLINTFKLLKEITID